MLARVSEGLDFGSGSTLNTGLLSVDCFSGDCPVILHDMFKTPDDR